LLEAAGVDTSSGWLAVANSRALATAASLFSHTFSRCGRTISPSAVPSAASEQGATELGFQKLYRARRRWLGDSAKSRSARKIPFRADGQEIFDLVHFHNGFHSLLCVCSLDSVFSRQTTIE
jgi:hypothetical protein